MFYCEISIKIINENDELIVLISLPLGAIHKLRHTLRGGGGGRRSMTLCDKGAEDPNFCDITFQKQY